MIYILGGIAKSGKSLVSSIIVKEKQISVLSTDYIMMMLFRGNDSLNINIHASDHTVGTTLEPYLYGLIKTMVENDETYLLEGVHFTTSFARKLQEEFKDNVTILYLGYKDVSIQQKVEELNRNRSKLNNDWIFTESDTPIETITAYLINQSKKLHKSCLQNNLEYIDIYDINTQMDDVISTLIKKKKL